MPIPCQSQITEVTVHARGAVVRRRVLPPADLPAGDVELLVADLPLLCDTGSLRASVKGGRTLVLLRAALAVPEGGKLAGPAVEELRALGAQRERLLAEQERLAARRDQLLDGPLEPSLRAAVRGPRPPALAAPRHRLEARVRDALHVSGLLGDLAQDLDARLVELARRLHALQRQEEALRLRAQQAPLHSLRGPGHPARQVHIFLSGEGPIADLEISYVVPAARFWPLYTLRMSDGGRRAELVREALVAQRSGEDWSGVRLGLSTADLLYDARLPELPSLRYGRAQPPKRASYRPPPEGLERLFSGHDRAFGAPGTAPQPAPPPALQAEDLFGEVAEAWEDGAPGAVPVEITSRDTGAMAPPPAPPRPTRAPMPLMAPAPMMAPAPAGPPMTQAAMMPRLGAMPEARARASLALPRGGMAGKAAVRAEGFGGGGMREDDEAAAPPAIEPPLEPEAGWLDFDGLRLAGPASPRRGRLVREAEAAGVSQALAEARARIESLAPPLPVAPVDPLQGRGRYDTRYEAEGLCDVPGDGLPHRVHIGSAAAAPELQLRTVPQQVKEVYREAELHNPFPVPLLGGPVDVYVDGSLLCTTPLAHTDRGGALRVGMGVEERVRVARNARVEEQSGGLLGGSLAVVHTVSIEITSSLGQKLPIEVLDRAPVTDDKQVEIKLLSSKPEAQPYKQAERGPAVRGGLRWQLTLPPGGKATIEFQYRVTLPQKAEIVGGNRRE